MIPTTADGGNSGSRQFHSWSSPKLTAPNDKRAVQHSALFEISQHGSDGLIDLGGETTMILFQLIMGIPGLAGFMPDLQKANASFHQATSDQKLATIDRIAVRLSDGLRFMTNIERIAGFCLHAIREFKRLNSRVELRIIRTSFTMARVESLNEIQLCALTTWSKKVVAEILNQAIGFGLSGIDVCSLVSTGEK